MILEGRVEVTVGKEKLSYESGAFTTFGKDFLMTELAVESKTSVALLIKLKSRDILCYSNHDNLMLHFRKRSYISNNYRETRTEAKATNICSRLHG